MTVRNNLAYSSSIILGKAHFLLIFNKLSSTFSGNFRSLRVSRIFLSSSTSFSITFELTIYSTLITGANF